MCLRARPLSNPFFLLPLSSPALPTTVITPVSCSKPNRVAMARRICIAVVGDVHDDWDLEEDGKALRFLQADVVLFTGDFGNENVDVVRSISNLELPKAAIMGNHDAWNTPEFSQKRKDRVQLQLECLKEQHVGYRRLDFPTLELSVVGGRPFSCGGCRIFQHKLVSSRYNVHNMEESAQKIYKSAIGAPEGNYVIVLAHNGPTGLGSKINDICGRDWILNGGGDHGDPDLSQALSEIKKNSRICVPLVVFGHMHKQLAYRKGSRKMIVVGDDNTIYLNGAVVPRVKFFGNTGTSRMSFGDDGSLIEVPKTKVGTLRAFTLVEIQGKRIEKISEAWISVTGSTCEMAEQNVLYEQSQTKVTT